ncbi:DUF3540 domain-containing protein [Thermodesulfobacteriota bacterium]
MFQAAQQQPSMTKTRYFGPARILEINKPEGTVLLRMEGAEKNRKVWGRLAIPFSHEFKLGETVLAAGEEIEDLYVIGLLDAGVAAGTSGGELQLTSGVKAVAAGTPEAETLQVFSESGELIFEYDPESGKSRVNLPEGDLEFVTQKGNIDFTSARDIRFSSGQSIEMKGLQGIRMLATDAMGQILSSMTLRNRRIKLNSPEFGITAQRGDFQIHESKYIGKRFSGRIKNADLIMEKVETFARVVIGKAGNVYKTVEGLTQLKTGRMRTLVETSFHLKGKKAFMKAEKDFKINGEKIHLG